MKKTLSVLVLLILATAFSFAADDVVSAVKPVVNHVSHDVYAPFKYEAKGIWAGIKHLGHDTHVTKKPAKTASDGGPIATCRPHTNCGPDTQYGN